MSITAMNGKSSVSEPSESRGHWLEARAGERRESASGSGKLYIEAINESGTAAPPPLVPMGIRGVFYFPPVSS